MKTNVITLLLVLTAFTLKAQVDSVLIKTKFNRADSIRIQNLSKVDSAENKIGKATGKINAASNRLTGYDTLGQKAQALQSSLDEERTKLGSKIDSLKSKGLPAGKYAQKLDSLNRINPLEKLQTAAGKMGEGQSKIAEGESKVADAQNKVDQGKSHVAGVQGKIDEKQSRLQDLQKQPQGKVNEKLNLLSKESQGKGVLPTDANLPTADIPGAKLPDMGADLKTPELPSAAQPDVDIPSVDMKNNPLDKDLKTDLAIPDVKKPVELEKIGDVQNTVTDKTGDISGKISGYSEDAKNISSGNIDDVKSLKEDALDKASLDKEMGVLKEGEAAIDENKALLEQVKNPDERRKQVLARAKTMVAKQMAAREQVLQETMAKVTKYQSKAGTILSKKDDLPKRRDPLRKLKFHEKLVPGITLQLQKSDAVLLDVNPSIRYRLTSYWSAGAGWNERIIFGNPARPTEQTRLFGIRAFTEVIVFKGLAVRLDAERMNAFIMPMLQQQQDVGHRAAVMSYMAGLKKEFTFAPRVVGNVQFMYNLYDPHNYRLYPSRFNVRFGFEMPMKKRKR